MESVYAYTNFRDFLTRIIEDKKIKNPKYSMRAAAKQLAINPGTLIRIIDGSRRVTDAQLNRFIAFLKLCPREAEYFTLLIKNGQFKTFSGPGISL